MNIIDPILLVLLSLFALRGYFKGLFRETSSLVGLFAGVMVAVRYDEPVAALLTGYTQAPLIVLRLASFVALFFGVYFVFKLAGRLLHHLAEFLFLQSLNRVGGVVVGVSKGTAIVALVVLFLGVFPLVPQRIKESMDESYLARPLTQLAEQLVETGKAYLLPIEDSKEGQQQVSSAMS